MDYESSVFMKRATNMVAPQLLLSIYFDTERVAGEVVLIPYETHFKASLLKKLLLPIEPWNVIIQYLADAQRYLPSNSFFI